MKILLLFAAVDVRPEAVGFGTLLAGAFVVVVLLAFLGGDNKAELGDLGVNFLRFPVGVAVVVSDDDEEGAGDGADLGFVGVAELPPSFRTRPAGSGVAAVFGGAMPLL